MLNPLAFNYKIHVQKIPERERGEEKKSHFIPNGVTKFLVIFCFVSPERQSRDQATRSLLCCGTEGHDLVVAFVLLGLWLNSIFQSK